MQSPAAVADADDEDEFEFDPDTRRLTNITQGRTCEPVADLKKKRSGARADRGLGRRELRERDIDASVVGRGRPSLSAGAGEGGRSASSDGHLALPGQ